MMRENFVQYLEGSIRDNWKLPAFSDWGASSLSYGEVGERIYRLHALFEASGLKAGDKVALLGRNSSSWATCYLAVVTYGAVIVPILPDFHPHDVETIVDHSESRLFFTTEAFLSKLDQGKMPGLKGIFSLDGSGLLSGGADMAGIADKAAARFEAAYRERLAPGAFGFGQVPNEALAAIVYTPGRPASPRASC